MQMEPDKPLPPSAVADEVLASLRRIIHSIDLYSHRLVRRFGLTSPQLLILKQVQRHGEISVNRLAQSISLQQTTVTDILNRLEAKGLITRARDSVDKRRVYIRITPECSRLLEDAPSPFHEAFLEKFQELQQWQQSMVLASLQLLESTMINEVTQEAGTGSSLSQTDSDSSICQGICPNPR